MPVEIRSIPDFEWICELTWFCPSCAATNVLKYTLRVDLWVHSISVSNGICKLAESRPPSTSPNLLNQGLLSHILLCPSTASMCVLEITTSRSPISSSNSVAHSLEARLWLHSTLGSESIHTLARSQPLILCLCPLDCRFQAHFNWLSCTTNSLGKYTIGRWISI